MPVPFGVESNLLRNQFTGPGINNWDVSLAKTTAINERFTLQLRFEFYNLFNRTQFAKPDTNIQDALFGYSSAQVGQNDGTTGARQVQIGAKLTSRFAVRDRGGPLVAAQSNASSVLRPSLVICSLKTAATSRLLRAPMRAAHRKISSSNFLSSLCGQSPN